ncbi:protein FAR1-RELATED SEQUENCE 9-like [Silene latifolia]|uniref:protein FAR1-RELATED SEQUENCE 9-like n=1 Tax=Silene latifolia TaxID=37657 RepID=UPI003D77393B
MVIPGCQPCLEKGGNGSQLIFVMFLWVVYYEQLNVKESNNFFKHFENAHGTLVEFLMRFQSAIDVQRHTQKQLDRDDDCTLPQLATSLKLEAHASKVYTNAAFSDFQVEASASICSLSVGGFTPPANGVELIGIADAKTQKTYQVVYNSLTNDAKCSCKLFN